MSDHDEPELDELERQLDAAFATTRPRRGFEDELWSRLQARRPRPRRASRGFPWAAAGGLAVLLVVVLGVYGLVAHGGLRGGVGGAETAQPASRAPLGAAAQPRTQRLLVPVGAGVPQVVLGGRLSPLPAGSARLSQGASLPRPQPALPVYTYAASDGPPDGTVLEPDLVPPGLQATFYPSQQPGPALAGAAARAAAANPSAQQLDVTLTQARLVYVAVVSGGQGYLEPAYLFTGTAQIGVTSVPAQVLVPAVAAAEP